MKYTITIAALLMVNLAAKAQSFDHKDWKLSLQTNMDSVAKSDVVNYPFHYLMYKENVQIYVNTEKTAYHKYEAKHVKVHINSMEGINKFKEIYASGSEFFQYRIIKADGEIIDNANIKDKKEEESQEFNINISNLESLRDLDFLKYLISSGNKIEGLDSNCQLEYIVVNKQEYLGDKGDKYGMNYIQTKVPIYNYTYNLITPDNYFFKITGVNGCPPAKEEESDDKNYLTVEIPKVESIKYSPIIAYNANKLGFLFTLYRNTFNSKTETFYNYSNYSRGVYENVMRKNPKDKSILKKLLKKYPALVGNGDEKHVKEVEKTLKAEFGYAYGNQSLSDVVKTKTVNNLDRLKLICKIFSYQDIKFQIVNPVDRREYVFMKEYDNFLFLNEALLYFPSTEVYMDAASAYNYVDLIPSAFREGYAVHTKAIGVGDFETGAKYIDSILPLNYKRNAENHTININMEQEAVSASVNSTIGGFHGLKAWSGLKDMNYNEQQDLYVGLAKLSSSDALVSWGKMSKISKYASPLDSPVNIEYNFSSKELLNSSVSEKNVAIGGFINSAKDVMPKPDGNYAPDNYSGYLKNWEIAIEIPKGYQLKNAAELSKDYVFASGKMDKAMGFTIAHKVQGDKLIINVQEFMTRGKFLPQDMDNFLKIYNAGWLLKDLKASFVKI